MTHVCSCPRQYELGQEQSRQDKVIEVTSFVISNHAVWLRSTSSIRCLTAPLGQHSTLLASWHDVLSQMAACGIVGLMGLSFVFVFSKSSLFAKSFSTKSAAKKYAANYTGTPGWISSSKARTIWRKKPWQAMNFVEFHIWHLTHLTFPPAFESHEPRVSALRSLLLVAIHIIVIIGAGPCETKGWLTARLEEYKDVEGCRF